MNENLLRRIKRQLNAKFYVMKDAWLKDCVEFFVQDKAPHEMTDRHIFEFVEGQWQLSDLREISDGCLPRNLLQQTCTILTGTYILQVDKMYDIASSKYKQLCEIRKIDNDNLEVKSQEEEKSAEWQPKGRRMMQLCLTDGVQDVTAIEYTPVKQITGTLLPGYKVMIIGPIDCRRGIILLEDSKYKEIGGEVDSLLKPNALENVLARALGEPENPDPYNDNEPLRIMNQNNQNTASDLNNDDNLFDDDFEEVIDLEAVTALERRSQETEDVQGRFENRCNLGQTTRKETNEILEETLEDIDFEPFENWPSDSPKLSRVFSSRMETRSNENDIVIIGEASTSTHNFCRSPPSTNSVQNQNFSEFPDDDFDFNDFDVVIKTKESQSQHNPLKNKSETCPPVSSTLKSTNRNVPIEIEKCTSTKTTQNEKSTTNSSKSVQQMPKTKTISNFFKPPPVPKICDILSDVLREPITGTMYRTVRGQVEKHSALTKQDKCWSVTALITDHTSSVEVCFQSEVLEEFLGFTVQEFSQKKKLAKSDPQVKEELVLNLRKAQSEIQNLDALLKLELVKDQMPKVVSITQLTEQ